MIGTNLITLLASYLLITPTIARPFPDNESVSATPASGESTIPINELDGALSALEGIDFPPVLHKQKRNHETLASSSITTILAERQDTAGLPLLGPNGICGDFSFEGSTFSALCLSLNGSPEPSSVDLNPYYVNSFGTLQPMENGGAFNSCSTCSLATDTVNLTCKCATGATNEFAYSTVNLDGTTESNGYGVYVQDNGKIAFRAS